MRRAPDVRRHGDDGHLRLRDTAPEVGEGKACVRPASESLVLPLGLSPNSPTPAPSRILPAGEGAVVRRRRSPLFGSQRSVRQRDRETAALLTTWSVWCASPGGASPLPRPGRWCAASHVTCRGAWCGAPCVPLGGPQAASPAPGGSLVPAACPAAAPLCVPGGRGYRPAPPPAQFPAPVGTARLDEKAGSAPIPSRARLSPARMAQHREPSRAERSPDRRAGGAKRNQAATPAHNASGSHRLGAGRMRCTIGCRCTRQCEPGRPRACEDSSRGNMRADSGLGERTVGDPAATQRTYPTLLQETLLTRDRGSLTFHNSV